MIVYKNIMEKLKEAGYSSYRLMKEGLISQASLTSLRNGKSVTLNTIDTICALAHCQPGDILEYVETEESPASE